jgi:hypothetical protein
LMERAFWISVYGSEVTVSSASLQLNNKIDRTRVYKRIG